MIAKIVAALYPFHIDSYNQLWLIYDLFSETMTLISCSDIGCRKTFKYTIEIWRVESVQVYHLILQIPQKWLLKNCNRLQNMWQSFHVELKIWKYISKKILFAKIVGTIHSSRDYNNNSSLLIIQKRTAF